MVVVVMAAASAFASAAAVVHLFALALDKFEPQNCRFALSSSGPRQTAGSGASCTANLSKVRSQSN